MKITVELLDGNRFVGTIEEVEKFIEKLPEEEKEDLIIITSNGLKMKLV